MKRILEFFKRKPSSPLGGIEMEYKDEFDLTEDMFRNLIFDLIRFIAIVVMFAICIYYKYWYWLIGSILLWGCSKIKLKQ